MVIEDSFDSGPGQKLVLAGREIHRFLENYQKHHLEIYGNRGSSLLNMVSLFLTMGWLLIFPVLLKHNYFVRHPRLKQLYQVLCKKRPETVYEMSEFNIYIYCKHMCPFVKHLLKYRFYQLVVKPNLKSSTRKKKVF